MNYQKELENNLPLFLQYKESILYAFNNASCKGRLYRRTVDGYQFDVVALFLMHSDLLTQDDILRLSPAMSAKEWTTDTNVVLSDFTDNLFYIIRVIEHLYDLGTARQINDFLVTLSE